MESISEKDDANILVLQESRIEENIHQNTKKIEESIEVQEIEGEEGDKIEESLNELEREYEEKEKMAKLINVQEKEGKEDKEKMDELINVLEKEDHIENASIVSESECRETGLSPGILDFSSGSSDYYIPNTDEDTSEDSFRNSKQKKKRAKLVRYISESSEESDDPTIEPQPGCSHSNARKKRLSLKERRADRKHRLSLRNAGQSYVTKLGKLKPGRNLGPLTDCRLKCNSRIPDSAREFIFKEYWLLGSYDERAKYTERLITINKKKCILLEQNLNENIVTRINLYILVMNTKYVKDVS